MNTVKRILEVATNLTQPPMKQGLVKKGRMVGMDIVEITPSRDINGITAITAGRFICNLIGSAVRAGYFEN